jgi:hypothetical protein
MAQTRPIPLSEDERVELARLREEVARLRREAPAPNTSGSRQRHRVRTAAAAFVIAVGCLLAPLSVVSVWLSTQLTDTQAYLDTVSPLIKEPAVQKALATTVTTEIFARLDIQDNTTKALQSLADRTDLPPVIEERLVGLAVPITDGVEGFVTDQVNSLVSTPEFEQAWVDANRVAHQGLIAAMTGREGGAVEVDRSGTVSVNVAAFIDIVKQRLVDRGFTVAEKIPDVQASFVVVQSADLARAQTLFAALDTLGTIFPFIVLAILGGGVLLAVHRRPAFIAVGLGVAGSMVLLGVLLAVLRSGYLSAIPSDVLSRDAAAAVFDGLVAYLRTALRSVLLLGLVIAAAAYLTGPATLPRKTRAVIRRGAAAIRGWGGGNQGLAGATVGHAIRAARRPLQVLAIVVAGLTLVFWDRPTPGVLLGVVLVLLAFLGVVEVLSASEPAAEPPATGSGPDSSPPEEAEHPADTAAPDQLAGAAADDRSPG